MIERLDRIEAMLTWLCEVIGDEGAQEGDEGAPVMSLDGSGRQGLRSPDGTL